MNLESLMVTVPDFPKPGVLFRDLSPIFAHPQAIAQLTREFSEKFDLREVDAFVGIEARGFVLASLLALHNGKGCVLLRKAGKLPQPVVAESYELEYGSATLEMSPGKGRVVIVDDVLATGGTLGAAIRICARAGYTVQAVGVIVNLHRLHQMTYNDQEIPSLFKY